jgi:hypothetical protein
MSFWTWNGNPATGYGYCQKRGSINTNQATVYSGSATFSSGSTATSSNTFSVNALTGNTTVAHEIFVTNDGPYDVTADVYKTISAGATVSTNIGVFFLIPASAASAGVTIGGKGVQVQGLFNVDLGLTIRLTVTAAFTALVTNNVLIKELDL